MPELFWGCTDVLREGGEKEGGKNLKITTFKKKKIAGAKPRPVNNKENSVSQVRQLAIHTNVSLRV